MTKIFAVLTAIASFISLAFLFAGLPEAKGAMQQMALSVTILAGIIPLYIGARMIQIIEAIEYEDDDA